jgi:hypothetical protein
MTNIEKMILFIQNSLKKKILFCNDSFYGEDEGLSSNVKKGWKKSPSLRFFVDNRSVVLP